jgi:hypothetical protein
VGGFQSLKTLVANVWNDDVEYTSMET